MLLIKNGLIVDVEQLTLLRKDVLVGDDGVIINIDSNIECKEIECKIIDASDFIVSPGLIDCHVHFRDPGFTYKEDLYTGSASAVKGGFTTVICMGNTSPCMDNVETINYFENKAKTLAINVKTVATVTENLKGKKINDLELLKSHGAVGFSDDGINIDDTSILYDAMNIAKKLNVPISLHEEDARLIGTHGINEGEISSKLNIKGAKEIAETSSVARDVVIAVETGAKTIFQHLSSAKSLDILEFYKKNNNNIFCEINPFHFSYNESIILQKGGLAKLNPPIRNEENRLRILEHIKKGTVDVIASDHAPHAFEEKNNEFAKCMSGIVGLETSLSLGITHLVEKEVISLPKLISMMTINISNIFNLNRGKLQIGEIADITIFSSSEKTVVGDFESKSQNSPLISEELTGSIKYTICNGKIVYKKEV